MLRNKFLKSTGHVALILMVLATSFVISAKPIQAATLRQSPKSPPATEISGSYAVEWMRLLYDRVEAETVSAPGAARVYGYAGIALYEAVWPGIPGNNSMAGNLNGLGDLPYIDENAVYDWPSVAAGSMSTVINGMFPGNDATHKAVAALREKQIMERSKATSVEIVDRSVAQGEAVGKTLLEWIATDNYEEMHSKAWTIPTGDPSLWVVTTPGTKPVEPYWGSLRPLALDSSDSCNVKQNMPFSTDPASAFYAQAQEVKTVGENLTKEQRDTADYWVDTPGQTGAPAGHWMSIVSSLVEQKKLPLGRASETYGLVGIAVADAFISCWDLKYQINLIRPETYIKQYIRKSWAPYIQTPPFPEFPSGHSVVSAAAAEVLTGMFGVTAFKDDTHRKHGLPSRSYTSFEAAATEAAISRLYGGIHFRNGIEAGLKQGRCVGERVLNRVRLRPRPQGEG